MQKAELTGSAFCRALSDAADAWLQQLLGDEADVALVAVGGYGRRLLAPYSDLDVVLVHKGRRDVKKVADLVWYPVWDAGIALDHSVRTVKEALSVAADDLKAAVGVLDARFVAGDETLAHELVVRARESWRSRPAKSLLPLRDAVAQRHESAGEIAFLLEPDLKEGRGGLRDIGALRAASAASRVLGPVNGVVGAAEELLLRVRVELHRRSGRAQDRLALQEQDAVAAACGFSDADALMAAVASAARAVAWESDDAWRRVSAEFSKSAGELGLPDGADVRNDPVLPWRLALGAVQLNVPLSRAALEAMAAASPPPSDPWPAELRDVFVRLLESGRPAIAAFEALDHHGLVVRALPEWESVRSRPQRNAYHRFTVDRHLLETAANAAALVREVARPDLLVVGALLHDIGKGVPGRDHTEAGIEIVGRVGARLGFSSEDVELLQAMVRHHLLLPDVATRRDLDDPATIDGVAGAVAGRSDLLELLAALTAADSEATGPSAWGSWKAGLVADLAARVRRRMAGQHPADVPQSSQSLLDRFSSELRERSLHVLVDGAELAVVAPDRPGLFSRVAGTLALHGLDVREAQAASTEDGMAVECFVVEPASGRAPDWERVRRDVGLAVRGRLSIEARLAARIRDYSGLGPRVTAAAPPQPRVLFDNDASATATVVEVRAPDAIGVLYRITRALADCDLDVRSAKVSTLGHEVVDAFYVRDAAGGKVDEADYLAEIERAVLAELARLSAS